MSRTHGQPINQPAHPLKTIVTNVQPAVSSRSVSYLQAMLLASVMEFSGAMGVGSRVAETIRTKVVSPTLYANDPSVLMLAMVCAITASAICLSVATRFGMPVSTTHSIMGGVIGAGVASVGARNTNWSVNGVSQVFVAWVSAPGIAAVFAALIFLSAEYLVMERKNPAMKALISVPFYFTLSAAMLAMLLVWKGASSRLSALSEAEVAGIIIGIAFGVGLLSVIFLLPWMYRKVMKNDWQLRWWHIALGPLLLRRSEPPPPPGGMVLVRGYYSGYMTREQLDNARAIRVQDTETALALTEANKKDRTMSNYDTKRSADSDSGSSQNAPGVTTVVIAQDGKTGLVGPKPEGSKFSPRVLFWYVKRVVLNGVDQDIVNMQKKKSILSGDLEETHSHVKHYDNQAEFMYSFLQVLTASVSSFTHGANDVSNAIGPLATIFDIWNNGRVTSSTAVPDWILAYGGAAIIIGLWMYGYNIMRNLGNRLTLHSPVRGFSMELGSAMTIVIATRLKLPVSTTQCICGATVGVGLCSGSWRSINWRMVSFIYFGWFVTLPVTGIISGCLLGIILNAPQWGRTVRV